MNLVILRSAMIYGPYVDCGSKWDASLYPVLFLMAVHSCYTVYGCCCDIWIHQATDERPVSILFILSPRACGCLTCLRSWGPGKHPNHTVHVDDIVGCMWACAQWIAGIGRQEANSIAGEEILCKSEKVKLRPEGLPPPDKKCIAPLFSIVSVDCGSVHGPILTLCIGGRQSGIDGGAWKRHHLAVWHNV